MKYSFEDRRVVCKGDYWIAPDAIVIGSVIMEPNASVWFGCIVRADNDTITIGKNASIGHMAMLHGCSIGDGSLVGIKSVILNGAKVGRNCLIGANSLIAENKVIPDGSLVVGSPGKVVRQLSEAEVRQINSASDHYVQKYKRYRESFRPDGA